VAGAAGGGGDAGRVVEEVGPEPVGQRNHQGVGQTAVERADPPETRDAAGQSPPEVLPQRGLSGRFGGQQAVREFGGHAETDDAGDVLSAGAQAAFLAGAD